MEKKWRWLGLSVLAIALILFLSADRFSGWNPSFGKSVLHAEQSRYQYIEVVRLQGYGNALLLDGEFQLSEADESMYHEALVHPALFMVDRPAKVLVIGGGDGGAVKELLKHYANVTLVELDERVLNVSKTYFPFSKAALENPRVRVVVGDGRSYLHESRETFDVILVDLSDPDNEKVALLYTREYYLEIRDHLAQGGVFVTQAESPYFYPKAYASIYKTASSVFNTTRAYATWVPLFGQWGFVMGCRFACDPVSPHVLSRVRESKLPFINFNADALRQYFLLDRRTKALLEDEQVSVNEDETLKLVRYNLVPQFR